MRERKQTLKKMISFLLLLAMLMGMITTAAFAQDSVVTDSTDFDVFMNVDASLGIDPTAFKNKVSGYLDTLLNNEDKTYRIETTAATIDPTDITKWEVYSHYDTRWFANEAAWRTSYNGGVIPANWYYYPVTDSYYNAANQKTKLEYMLNDKAGATQGGTYWGGTAGLESHIYAYLENGKPAMQIYGYGTSNWADFLYYPASATSTKTVKFDVDASNVLPHSLKYAGFLINAGTTGTGASKTMDGYAILFEYGPANSTTAATQLIGAYLYRLNGVNVNKLHAEGLKGISSGASKIGTSSFTTLYSKSHIELSITPTGLTATIQQLDAGGQLTGSKTYLFGDSSTPQVLNSTGYGGFGPYVDFGVTGHTCTNTSSFRYSNLEMSFSEALSGSSPLEAYQYADYLNESGQRFFVNLTSNGVSYEDTASDTDNAYLTRIAADQTILITDEYTDTYLPDSLGENAKSVTEHIPEGVLDDLYTGSDTVELLAAKVAWLIYHANHGTGGTIGTPTTVAIASLLLLDRAPWTGAKQVNQIKKELMDGGELKVYLNSDNSINAFGLTAAYTLTNPSGVTTTLSPETDEVSGKQYFTVSNSWNPGEYTVTLSHAASGSITSTIPATASFAILTDAMAPSVSAVVSGVTATLSFVNTPSTGNMSYTSDLVSYATVINTSSAKPSAPDSSEFISVSGMSATASIGDKTAGSYYLHIFLEDAAGNVGYASQAFTVTGPAAAFTTPATNSYTSESRYQGDSIAFSLTPGTYGVKSYQIGTGDATADYGAPVDATDMTSAEYQLPVGANRIWVKAIDAAGNESTPISIYVDAKKHQVLSGTGAYILEAGVDKTVILDYTAASDPALEEGESLGAVTYDKLTDANASISLTDNIATIRNYTGEAAVRVTAAATATHREATEEITIKVVKPFSVSLVTSAYDAQGITVVPAYNDEGEFGVSDVRELKYRKVGTSAWTILSADGWSWDNGCKVLFSGLSAGAEYEILLSGQNARTVPTKSTASLNFKVPVASSAAGKIEVELEDTDTGKAYHVSVRSGDAVLHSDTVTGDGGDMNYTFSNLPDGFYNVVVEHEGETVTNLVEVRGGVQTPNPLKVKIEGYKNTRVLLGNELSPKVAVDGLNELFIEGTANTDDAAGVTSGDNVILDAGGAIVIDLVSTGLKETDVPVDVSEIKKVSNGQALAMVVDLSLYKTVRELNAVEGSVSRLTSTPSRITVAIPLEPVNGTGLRAYRVHGGVAQMIPQAVWSSLGSHYVWAEQYTLGGTTLTRGAAVGAGDEFVVLTTGYAIFHVNKFSTYAIGYTRYVSNSVINPTVVKGTENGVVTVSSATQESGKTVTVTVKPDDGYVLGSLHIADANGAVITYQKTGDGVYQFTMPSSAVSVTASFVKKIADPQDTGVARWLITDDHISYMRGDDYGRFNPDEKMSRAEVAQMFYNLLREKDVAVSVGFTDLPDAAWYKKAVEALASMGIVTGYNGKYRPEEPITRAEFTAIAMRFAEYTGGSASFSDVSSGSWAYSAIMSAAGYGWITGYTDGTFKPDAYIKRAEVVTIVNHMLGRSADKVYISSNLGDLKIFPDAAQSSYWAYYDIIEATNGHDFKVSDAQEVWTGID